MHAGLHRCGRQQEQRGVELVGQWGGGVGRQLRQQALQVGGRSYLLALEGTYGAYLDVGGKSLQRVDVACLVLLCAEAKFVFHAVVQCKRTIFLIQYIRHVQQIGTMVLQLAYRLNLKCGDDGLDVAVLHSFVKAECVR